MLQRAALKLGLERAVLGSVHDPSAGAVGGSKRSGKHARGGGDGSGDAKGGVSGRNMSPKELEKMLREGA